MLSFHLKTLTENEVKYAHTEYSTFINQPGIVGHMTFICTKNIDWKNVKDRKVQKKL